jgi:signal transduction histidine kinase
MAFGRLCLAGAALHPSMKLLGARSSETPSRGVAGSRRRLAVLAGASLLAPGVVLEQYVTGQSADIPVIATSSALLFLLVVARMGNLLQVQAEMNRQLDESLRKLHQVDQELRHAQKLEAIGKLAGGIAHEINTPIQFIGDNVRFLGTSFSTLEKLATGRRQTNGQVGGRGAVDEEVEFLVEEVPRAIRETLEGVERVATIVGAMKAFGHPGDGQQADVDLNEALRNAVTVARSELRAVAEVDFELGDLPLVRCFPADLNQVLLNLIVNAAHAVAETGRPGRLGLATRVEGDEVVVAISDTGVGIPEEIRDRVFEPFFTTKAVGEGTGQGLSLVWTLVVERHHGTVSFTSQRDVGTTFTIRLPLAGVREDELAAAS